MKRILSLILAVAGIMALLVSCAAEEPTVQSLVLAVKPDKTEYLEGEEFDPTGARVDANMSDGTVREGVEYELTVPDRISAKRYKVTFSYGGQSVSLNLDIRRLGNEPAYSVANTPELESSPLRGKTFMFLGSSVTFGAHSEQESMAEFIAKRNGAVCIKEAVSGTTLMDTRDDSYVRRLDAYLESADRAESLDAFICQLSTNDIKYPDSFGSVTAEDKRSAEDFDTATTAGAMEYIIVRARETWGCPVLFYTNSNFRNEKYEQMIAILDEIQAKWDIGVIDLFRDEEFNNVTAEELELYMYDPTHPTRAGYRDWWTPKFEEKLTETVG